MADITLTGNLGSDSELTFTPNGKAKLEFSVGDTPRRLNQQTNQWEDAGETTWWRVTEWEKKAEYWAEHLLKGTKVLIVGTAAVRTYEKKDGSKGFSAEVKPKTIAVIPRSGNQPAQQQSQQPAAQSRGGGFGGYNAATQATMNQPAEDPWATPGVSNSGGWGNGPAAGEPAF